MITENNSMIVRLNQLLMRDCLSDEERLKIKKYFRYNLPPDAVLGSHVLWFAFTFKNTDEGGEYWLSVFDRLRNEELANRLPQE